MELQSLGDAFDGPRKIQVPRATLRTPRPSKFCDRHRPAAAVASQDPLGYAASFDSKTRYTLARTILRRLEDAALSRHTRIWCCLARAIARAWFSLRHRCRRERIEGDNGIGNTEARAR